MNSYFKRGYIPACFALLLFLLPNKGFCQGNAGFLGKNYVPTVVSPEAAAMGKFLNFPVVENSGIPTIDVPLASLGYKNFTIPLKLNYHGSGIKVNQDATWVGLGWSLSGGGAISREVRGIPDDEYYWKADDITGREREFFGWLKSYLVPYNAEQIKTFPYMPWDGLNPETNAEPNASITFIRLFDGTNVSYTSDTEPDIFFVNAPGLSFKFVFDDQGNPRVLGLSNCKIEYFFDECEDCLYNMNPIKSFVITNEDGVKYFFEEEEISEGVTTKVLRSLTTSTKITLTDDFKYRSSWLLTKIRTPAGFYANYNYYPVKEINSKQPLVYNSNGCSDIDSDLCTDIVKNINGEVESVLGKKYLKSITTHEEKVTFYLKSGLRQDLPGAAVLNKFFITSRASGQVIKRVELNLDYVSSSTADCSLAEDESYCKRLFLNTVNVFGNDDEGKTYSLEYYNSYPLPPKHSFEQDFWGHYNNNNATTILPKVYIYPEKVGADRFRIYPLHHSEYTTQYIYQGANRDVNADFITAGSLAKITFPTGGSVAYNYEPNDFYDEKAQVNNKGGGIRVNNITFYDPVTEQEINKSFVYKKMLDGNEVSSGRLINLPSFAHERGYAFDPNFLENGDFYFMTRAGRIYLQNMIGLSCDPSNGGYSNGRIDDCEITSAFSDEEKWKTFTEVLSYSLSPLSELEGVSVQYERMEISKGGSGKEVHTYYPPKTHLSHSTSVKSTRAAPFGEDSTPCLCELYDFNNCVGPDMYVGYGNIQFSGSNIYPFPKLSDNGIYTYGKLKAIEYRNQNGDLVKDKIYKYQNKFKNGVGPEIINGLVHTIMPIEYVRNSRNTFPKMYGHYRIDAEAGVHLQEVNTREILAGAEIETNEYYAYNDKLLLQSFSRTLSDGAVEEVRYRYPQDYNLSGVTTNSNGLQLKAMIENNILNTAIETITLKGNNVVKSNYSSYEFFNDTLMKVKKMFAMESQNPIAIGDFSGNRFSGNTFYLGDSYQQKAIFDYNTSGMVSKAIFSDGVTSSYLWGYNRFSPIAEVSNANPSEIAYTSFENNSFEGDIDGNWTIYNKAPISTVKYKTGKRSYLLTSQTISISGLSESKAYIVSYWTTSPEPFPHIGGTVIKETDDGEWTLYTHEITGKTSFPIIGTGYIDELRLHPVGALMTTFGYNPLIGLSYSSDENNIPSIYKYDGFGRLKRLKDHKGNVIEEYRYNYKD